MRSVIVLETIGARTFCGEGVSIPLASFPGLSSSLSLRFAIRSNSSRPREWELDWFVANVEIAALQEAFRGESCGIVFMAGLSIFCFG